MKLKKVLLQIGLLLAFVGVGVVEGQLTASANPSGVPSDATLLSGNTFVKDANTAPGNKGSSFATVKNYPDQPDGVYANGVDNGRITNKTTKFFVKFTSGNDALMFKNQGDYFVKVYPDITDQTGNSLVTNSVAGWGLAYGDKPTSVRSYPSGWTELDVDLSGLGSTLSLPLYLGFSYDYDGIDSPGTAEYYTIKLVGDSSVTDNWQKVTIDGNGTVSSTATKVTGTAEPGLKVALSGVDGSLTADVGLDGKYTFDLGTHSLKDLNAASSIKVTEYNNFGDSKSATADVKDSVPLTTTAASSSVAVDPDTLSGNITGKSDAEILAWLSGQSAAGLTTTKEGSTTALTDADGLTYTADATDLASKIATATAANPLTINVSASDSAGDKTTATTPIKIYTTDGTFKFNSLSDFAFGTLPVPAQETLFAPTNTPSILIDDTQTVGKDWYVTANATKMTDSASNELNGDMVYVDADGAKHNLTNTTTLVGQGQRESGKTTAEVADGWANAGATVAASKFTDGVATGVTKGIYLDAHPNIYTGGVADGNAYTGAINWTLTNSVSGS
ncbi:hypothetical protein [Levilactobacillus yiduensis]|uniref:hypothetical protein n=1 Tax=Levilactobacillus yiduensis TaxID=2953880 RepID=UPI002157F2D7|nr:hypothetical protein [Levilactobacillus yiduensis]